MDKKKWEALRGGAGFYVALAVCLLAVGFGGWKLLSDRGEAPAEETAYESPTTAGETEETEPVEEAVPVKEAAAPAVVETIQPEPVEETSCTMPGTSLRHSLLTGTTYRPSRMVMMGSRSSLE